jgi:quinone-modifying oxidoreductase subunit QmoC
MNEWQSWPRFRYEAELDLKFPEEVASMPGGRALFACIQCGTCSGTCPLATYMDYSPRKIIAMTRAGFKEEVLRSFTIWLCASCYACTVECPRKIKITDFMAELKQRAIHDRVAPKRFPAAVLAREFFEAVRRRGRNTESRLVLRLYAKTNPLRILGQALLGLKLLRTGRFSLRAESVKSRQQIDQLLRAVDAAKATVFVDKLAREVHREVARA